MMDLVLKLAGIALLAVVISASLRKTLPEISLVLSVCASIAVLSLGSTAISSAITFLRDVAAFSKIMPDLFAPILKVLAISVVSKLTADFCKESGCLGLAESITLIGNTVATVCAIPLFQKMLSFLSSF